MNCETGQPIARLTSRKTDEKQKYCQENIILKLYKTPGWKLEENSGENH